MIYALLPKSSTQHGDHHHGDDDDDDGDDDHDHDEHDKFITEDVDVYEKLLKRYGTENFCEQILDQLLKDVNKTREEQVSDRSACC